MKAGSTKENGKYYPVIHSVTIPSYIMNIPFDTRSKAVSRAKQFIKMLTK